MLYVSLSFDKVYKINVTFFDVERTWLSGPDNYDPVYQRCFHKLKFTGNKRQMLASIN